MNFKWEVTLGSLLLLLLGGYTGHLLTIVRGKCLAKHTAAIELKKFFNPKLMQIKNGENPTIVIKANFSEQMKASQNFSAYLIRKRIR